MGLPEKFSKATHTETLKNSNSVPECADINAFKCISDNEEYFEILPFVTTWMDCKGIKLSEVRKKTNTTWLHLYVESKNKTNEQSNKQKQIHKYKEQTGGCQNGGGWGTWAKQVKETDKYKPPITK